MGAGGEGRAGDGAGGQAPVADGGGSGFVGHALGRVPDGVTDGAQGRVAVGGEFGRSQEVVVAVGVVGAFVGEEDLAFGRVETADHRGGDHDAAGPAGQGVGVRPRRVDDAQVPRRRTAGGLGVGGPQPSGLPDGGAGQRPAADGEQAGRRRGRRHGDGVPRGAQGVDELPERREGGHFQQAREDEGAQRGQ